MTRNKYRSTLETHSNQSVTDMMSEIVVLWTEYGE